MRKLLTIYCTSHDCRMRRLLFLPVLLLTFFLGNPASSADYHVSSAHYQKGVDAALRRDFATALREWKPLAEQGDATPQFQLGWMYEEGHGVTQDYKTAIKWYKLAAEQGYAYSQTALGHMYENGHGVLQDYARAYMWFNIAASLWDTDARKKQDIVAKKMNPTQIEEAQRLALECVKKNYKGC